MHSSGKMAPLLEFSMHKPKALFYGDNLQILRDHIPDESIDLVYLDPPFNSKADYNILFKEPDKTPSTAQITAFEDTWHWSQEAEHQYQEIIQNAPAAVVEMMTAFRSFIQESDLMAYLTMMCIRLVELRRVLKDTGSIYLHCDPAASHYLKVMMDTIFGALNYRNEIIWKRTSGHSDATKFGRVHDTILYYSKSDKPKWNKTYQPYEQAYVDQYYRYKDPDGRLWMSDNLSAAGLQGGGYTYEWKGVTRTWRCPVETMERLDSEGRVFYTKNGIARRKRYLDESKGLPAQDIWSDIEALRSWHKEKLGYPTQKPEGLIERILKASTDEGDTVLDPFCGCGTAVTVAQRLKRNWIGIDVTHLAVNLMKFRLEDAFGLRPGKDYEVHGEPTDLGGARALAEADRFQFQWWALSLIRAKPYGDKKKGADKGIDGFMYFLESDQKTQRVIVQVKSGHVKSGDIRDLNGTIDRENAAIGVFITLENPTGPMKQEAAEKGFYHSDAWNRDYPRVQILTIEEMLAGKEPLLPNQLPSHTQAQQAEVEEDHGQGDLFGEK